MAIPKIIYQTFKTDQIPWLTKIYIKSFMRKNKNYRYEFYDDLRVEAFIKKFFDAEVYKAYSRLQIGAAKADFFRYAILYVYGGIYLDLDSDILVNLDEHLTTDDEAVITREKNHQNLFAQWALIFEKGHPFLERTIRYVVQNIQQNKYPNDVHAMTGPTVYTRAVNDVIKEDPTVLYRVAPDDYKGIMKFKYKFGKLLIYRNRSQHWKKLQKIISVVKSED
ncbi:glycosyltransferase family 32 protein [Sphingobacterium siyangense]|uniref:glycosyltransferase family 32 protein n=1 Tax=Sphingobacterium siyangense TaxID=459529 RepID=UPI003DA66DD7